MEFKFLLYIASISLFLILLLAITKTLKAKLLPHPNLPLGSLGWPILGETLEFLRAGKEGKPEKFIKEIMEKYDSRVFKTCMLGEKMAVFCGTGGSKFLFSNENKLVAAWWPGSVRKLFRSCLITLVGDEAKLMRRILMSFLNPNALKKYIERMDLITQQHVLSHWEGKREIKVHSVAKLYTFELACRLFVSIDDPGEMSKFAEHFDVFTRGVIDLPVNVPGTRFYKAMRAANAIREKLKSIVRRRRVELESKIVSPGQDLLCHLIGNLDASGRFLSEMETVDNILFLLFAGRDTSRSTIALIMKCLGEMPQVFENVLKEQIVIAKSKELGELLKWENIQKMRYSWNVASEVMRLSPPASGAFREALVDFDYDGYNILKGWKVPSIFSSLKGQHTDERLFPDPEKFDTRFQGEGQTPYSHVPFGGGPRMCPGHEFARLQIRVFLHNIITRFNWDLLILDEKFGHDPMLSPSHGLPVLLQPHQFSS